MSEMKASVLLTLKDQLTGPAAKAKNALKPLEDGLKGSADRIKSTMSKLSHDIEGSLRNVGSGAASTMERQWVGSLSRMKAAGQETGAAIARSFDKAIATERAARRFADSYAPGLHAEREAIKADRRDTYAKRPLAAARAEYETAKSRMVPTSMAAGGIVVPATLAAAHQEQASAKIKMITDMDEKTRGYFDRAMLKLAETNVYDMKHSYEAAEKAARLSVYSDAVRKYGDTVAGREKAADHLVHWVDQVEKYSMMWGTAPEQTSEKLKYLKNQFHLDDKGVEHVADVNSLLSHKYGYKPGAMVDYLSGAGASLVQMGFTPDQAMAMGAGPLQKGINPSSTGTNLTQILNYMKTGRSKKGDASFEHLMGENHEQFFQKMKDDPWGSTMRFFEKAKEAMKTAKGTEDVSNIIGSRQLRNLANITESLEVTKAAYEKSKSHEVDGYADRKAKELREGTLENKTKMLWNSLTGSESMIGRKWLEPMKDAVDVARDKVNDFNEWMRESEEKDGIGQKAVSYGLGGIAAYAGTAATLSLLRAGGRLLGYEALAALPGVAGAASMALDGIAVAAVGLSRIAWPAALLYGGYQIVSHWSEIKASLSTIWDDIKAGYDAVMTKGVTSPEAKAAADKLGTDVKSAWSSVKKETGIQGAADFLGGDKNDWGLAGVVGGWIKDKLYGKSSAGELYGPPVPNAIKFGGRYQDDGEIATGPAVPTLVGANMAAGADVQAPAGVTIQANGPQVSFNQAPPNITTNVTVNVQTNASPGEIGSAVGSAVTGAMGNSGALHDGAY